MTKKKAAGETAATKDAKKKTSKTDEKNETNSADVRKRVSKMVKSKAMAMTKSVMGEAQNGVTKDLQLATVKYLFEVASIYPPQADQDSATADEDCFAKTLLHRLNIPDEPIRHEEDDEAKPAASAETTAAEPGNEGETKNPEPGLP